MVKGFTFLFTKTKVANLKYVDIDNILKIKNNNIFRDRKKYFCKTVGEFCIFANSCNVWLPRRQLLPHSVSCIIMCCVASRKFHCIPMRRRDFKKADNTLLLLFGGTSGKEPACQCWRHKRRGFDPWVGKIPRRRK